jgi:hypothetical protein
VLEQVQWALVMTAPGASPSLPVALEGLGQFVPHIFFGLDAMMVSTIILCITYAVIIWDKVNRALIRLFDELDHFPVGCFALRAILADISQQRGVGDRVEHGVLLAGIDVASP